ncbi:MAG: GAF domain-containing protein [Planctomycetota bacterium]|jgi:GAF domain-containing protein
MTYTEQQFAALRRKLGRVVRGGGDRDGKLLRTCELLAEGVGHYDWVGFYILDPAARALDLGPFVGEPTEHVRIELGRGVCGQAAEGRKTLVINDVTREPNYLCCSEAVLSEIVVPIFAPDGRFVAELDIDSHTPAAFDDADREFLEAVCRSLSRLF